MDLVYLASIGLFFALMLGLAAGCARLGRCQMTWLFILSGAVAAGLLVYLIAALINPENFS